MQPAIPLGLVFGFARRYCLPLHVAGRVCSPALQRLDMIDHIAGAPPARPASGRARMVPLEGVLGGGCSPDPAMPVPAGGRRGASGSMTPFVAADVGRRPRMASPDTVASTKCRGGHDGGQKEQPGELDELPANLLLPVNQHRESHLVGYFARNVSVDITFVSLLAA
jgi:hypothetical protein